MDEMSHTHNPEISKAARDNRRFLVSEMLKGGFHSLLPRMVAFYI
jgi:D-alanyl-D-alanine dipeptidase